MRIGYFWPAYRQRVAVQTAYTLARDLVWAMQSDHELAPTFADSTNVARTRNAALKAALGDGTDRLMMVDADCAALEGSLLARLMATMDETGAAAVGAVFVCRSGRHVNCEPARPGEVYEGEVGTGAILIDVAQVRELEPPWFVDVLSDDGTERACGEDVFFCRYLRRSGLQVVVDFTVPTVHVGEQALRVE